MIQKGKTTFEFVNPNKFTLDKQARAVGPDGTPIEAAKVLRALATPTTIARYQTKDAAKGGAPDLFYSSLFREGTLILLVDENDVLPKFLGPPGTKRPTAPAQKP